LRARVPSREQVASAFVVSSLLIGFDDRGARFITEATG
jgi:hypothetical protein